MHPVVLQSDSLDTHRTHHSPRFISAPHTQSKNKHLWSIQELRQSTESVPQHISTSLMLMIHPTAPESHVTRGG